MRRRTYPWLPKVARAGGKARMDRLTREGRRALGRLAARARWEKTPKTGRSEAARKAVLARWARAQAPKK